MGIGNLGLTEILIIAVIVLVFFGPRRLPEVARSVGRALREFKRGMNEIQRELESVEREMDVDRNRTRERADAGRDRPTGAPDSEGAPDRGGGDAGEREIGGPPEPPSPPSFEARPDEDDDSS